MHCLAGLTISLRQLEASSILLEMGKHYNIWHYGFGIVAYLLRQP